MLVETRTLGFAPTDAIVRHVESRMDAALAPFARLVNKVIVRLEDVNASRGGIDKRCSVVVTLRLRAVGVAEAIHADLYAAIDEAASRIRRSVRRAARRRLRQERPGRARRTVMAQLQYDAGMTTYDTIHLITAAGEVRLFGR